MNNLYDPNDFMILDINSKSKARSLKNVILDKKNLKKANIVLFKQVSSKEKQGQWAQAKSGYEQVLATRPQHFDALHMLGVLATQTQHAEQAVGLIQQAIRIKTGVASNRPT